MTLSTMRAITRASLLLVIGVLLTGCATYEQEFTGQTEGQVWSSMLAVAQTPNYDDPDPANRWTVVENEVWSDESQRRIEIYRKLERRLYQEPGQSIDQKREWRFQVNLLEPETPSDPPTARFVGRGPYIYGHVEREAKRYFGDVNELLGITVDE